jgi:hypothetical protein
MWLQGLQFFAVTCQSQAILESACNLPQPDTTNTIPTILNIVFAMAASIAVLMVVIGGFRYIVAHGDPGQTASAKNSILYAIVGLVVVMAAYAIVAFVVKGVG